MIVFQDKKGCVRKEEISYQKEEHQVSPTTITTPPPPLIPYSLEHKELTEENRNFLKSIGLKVV